MTMNLRKVAIRLVVVLAIIGVIVAALIFSFLRNEENCVNVIGTEPPQACETP